MNQQEMQQEQEIQVQETSGFSVVLELKPERIQEPQTAQAETGTGYRFSLTMTSAQPILIEIGEPKLTLQLYSQTLSTAA
jgi:hypothetical protein